MKVSRGVLNSAIDNLRDCLDNLDAETYAIDENEIDLDDLFSTYDLECSMDKMYGLINGVEDE